MAQKQLSNNEIAQAFFNHADYVENLVYHEDYDSFFLYSDGYYKELNNKRFPQLMWKFINFMFPHQKITAAMINDIITQVKFGCLRRIEHEDYNLISFKDKLFSMETYECEPFDKYQVTLHHIPYYFKDTQQDIPAFQHFLQTSLVKKGNPDQPDMELISLVQEMFGFFLIGNMKGAKAFFLVGGGANGKTVMADVVQNIIGKEFVSNVSIESLTTDKFKAQHLIGKRINITNEEESKYVKPDKFKSIVDGNRIDAERKFGLTFSFNPRTKFLFASNQLPTFKMLDWGLVRRIGIIPFYRKFQPHECDHSLATKLAAETAGIVGWAIKGAKRLVANNYVFTDCRASILALRDFENEISSALRFINDNYIIGEDYFTNYDDVYIDYRAWCEEYGKKPLSRFNFLRDVTANIDAIVKKVQSDGGTTKRGLNIQGKTQIDRGMDAVQDALQGDAVPGKTQEHIDF